MILISKFNYQSIILVIKITQHIVTIGLDRSLSNSDFSEDTCFDNIKKFKKYSIKCDNQQQYKSILEVDMLYTPKVFINKIPISIGTSVPMIG